MHNWNYTPDHPITLALASDARLGPTVYTDDQIWEINFGHSEPPALTVQSTFGLRARSCRIFPRFIFNDQVVTDPANFYQPIVIHEYYPNYIKLSFMPFSCVNVHLEYWVPNSQAIACRMQVSNSTHEQRSLQIEWAELLLPGADGTRMSASEFGMTTVLAGQTANLSPVFLLTGGAKPGKSPYPSLNLTYLMPPFGKQEASWVQATLAQSNDSFELSKKILRQNWDSEFARISRVNSQLIDIHTGNKDWNTAFSLAQTIAYQFILNSTPACQSASYVYTRNPDNGYSLRKDGTDYSHLWNGQTVFDSYYLLNFLLPNSPELIKSLLENFLETQNDEGEIDWKPGLAGQRTKLLATPLLANIALQWFEFTEDIKYLGELFPKLLKFFMSWFSSPHDRDGDLIPEWDQVAQTGIDDQPLFSNRTMSPFTMDISVIESPDLCSYLYLEGKALLEIANLIEQVEAVSQLEAILTNLKSAIEQSWNDQYASYMYRDRDSHMCTPLESIGTLQGQGVIEVHREFGLPIRPVIYIESKGETTRPVQIFIHGTGITGAHRVERIPNYRVHWQSWNASTTSEYTYSSLEHIEVNGLKNDDFVCVHSTNLTSQDLSLILPLWAGIPSDERAKILINLTIMNKKRFLSPYGLRSWIIDNDPDIYPEEFYGIRLPWIALIVEGISKYGERKKAAEIFTRMMKAIVQTVRQEMAFHQSYHSETGKGLGGKNQLSGLVPIRLFLKIIGVDIINQYKIKLSGYNPFPWQVTIKYRGLTIVKQEKKTLLIFPDGQHMTVDNDQAQLISIDHPLY